MKKRNSKRASRSFCDTDAFRMIQALLEDLDGHIPASIHKFIHGRLRSRDYEFVIETFPSSVLSLMQTDLEKDGVTLPLCGNEFSLGENPVKTIQLLYTVSSLLKKYPFESSSVYTEEYRRRASMRSFRKAEKWCYIVNRSLRSSGDTPLFREARRVMRWLLGDVPNYGKIVDLSYFGPGVNVGIKGDETDHQFKFSLDMTITPSLRAQLNAAADLMPATIAHYGLRSLLEKEGADMPDVLFNTPGRRNLRYERLIALGTMDLAYNRLTSVKGNKIALVPKTAKTHRSIAAEPMANSYFQNGVGRFMVKRFAKKTTCLDLRDQSRNREWAAVGSRTNQLATIDLSSASDTISIELVRRLVPKKWFQLLRTLRSPWYYHDGRWVKSQKFSSMGNGYTFPLESALFYSIVRAAVTLDLVEREGFPLKEARLFVQPLDGGPGLLEPSVYGDDIIVNSDHYTAVSNALKHCGFWTNDDKSYHTGPFRESCGHDYHYGDYVRPLFLKRKIANITDVLTWGNLISDPQGLGWASSRYNISFCKLVQTLFGFSQRFRGEQASFGPITGRSEQLFLSVMLDDLRSRGHIFEDTDRHRWVYDPICVVTRRFRDVSEFGVMLRAYHSMQGRREARYSNSLYSLIRRGEVALRCPKRSTRAKRSQTLPSVEMGVVPLNLDGWLANIVRYRHLYPFLKGW